MTRTSTTTRLLHNHANRVGFVEQTQLARFTWIFGIARIHEDASTHQNTVRLGNHRSDPAHVEIFTAWACFSCQTLINISFNWRFPETAIRGVDSELLGIFRNRQIRVRKHKFTQRRIQGEAHYTVTHCKNEHGRWTIKRIARSDLLRAWLQEGFV